MERMTSATSGLTENQRKMALMSGAAFLGATSALLVAKKLFQTNKPEVEEEQDGSHLREITLPAIVSDIDGVVIEGKNVIPGSKQAMEEILTPYADSQRCIPFTFLSNGGGVYEWEKAQKLNTLLGLGQSKSFLGSIFGGSKGPVITEKEMILSHTVFKHPSILNRFKDKWVLVEGYHKNDAELTMSYGYEKVISVQELTSLDYTVSPWMGVDFYESKWRVLQTQRRVLKRFGMTKEELLSQLKFSAIFLNCATHRAWTLTQILVDIVNSIDGSTFGPLKDPNDPQTVTVITTNPDLYTPCNHTSPRIGPKAINIALEAVYEHCSGKKLEIEEYGKPMQLNYDFTESVLQTRAAKQNIKISNFYMIGDNPNSDIAGAIKKGWVSILVRTGVFNPEDPTNVNGNDKKFPATHVVDTFDDAIKLIYRLENLQKNQAIKE